VAKFVVAFSVLFILVVLAVFALVVVIPTLDTAGDSDNTLIQARDAVDEAVEDVDEALEDGPIGDFFECLDEGDCD
jgi:hypothetical protein